MNIEQAAALLGRPLAALETVKGGGNSQVYRARAQDGGFFAVKSYPPRNVDPRDRLGAETSALRFLTGLGENAVPSVVAVDPQLNAAAFQWIDGSPVDASAAHVDQAMDFLARLHDYRLQPGASGLRMASEACLSDAELQGQLKRRFARLAGIDDPDLRRLLDDRVAGLLDRHLAGLPGDELLPQWRTLSPSDFGFHNALCRPDGRLVFIDFEYFGWDDPVKLAADIMLHPGMTLDQATKKQVARRAQAIYGADPHFSIRLSRFYPLIALRWVAIICNEFLPERWAVRAHAGMADRTAVQARQLAKATALLDQLPRDMTDILDAA